MTDEYPKLALVRQVVERYGNETELFRYLKQYGGFSKKDLRFLRNINALVTDEFGKIERESKELYVTHLHGVCAIGAVYCGTLDPELLAAFLLHDITEEFPRRWSYPFVEAYSRKGVAELVHICSIDRNYHYYESKEEYLESYFKQIGQSPRTVLLKLCDRLHNQLTLSACSVEKQCLKNRETERYVLPLALKHSILAEELEESIRETRSRLALITTP